MISGFCQKQYGKCHSIYLCLWFCLLLNASAVSAILYLQYGGILLLVVRWCWVLLSLFGFYFMAGRNLVFLLIVFIIIFEVFHLCLRERTRLYF